MTTLESIRPVDLAAAVRQVAVEHPDGTGLPDDGTVGSCIYFDAFDQPSCIVGHGLHRMGVASLNGQHCNMESVDDLGLGIAGPELTDADWAALRWLSQVQAVQDDGITWAKALALADGEGVTL